MILDLVAYLSHLVVDRVALIIGLPSLHLMGVRSLVVVSTAWISGCHLLFSARFGVLFQISWHRASLRFLLGLLLLEVDAVVVQYNDSIWTMSNFWRLRLCLYFIC